MIEDTSRMGNVSKPGPSLRIKPLILSKGRQGSVVSAWEENQREKGGLIGGDYGSVSAARKTSKEKVL